MDGNNRWSKKKHLNLFNSYYEGGLNLLKISKFVFSNYQINYISAFALSKNNLNRPKYVISTIKKVLDKVLHQLDQNKIDFNIKFIGDLSFLDNKVLKKISEIQNLNSESNNKLIIFLNYSGRVDIENAFKIKVNLRNKSSSVSNLLSTRDIPDPDLLIRTGGYQRISNFLLYELAFTELIFTKTLWPDLKTSIIKKYIQKFNNTERKFGI
jgi:undecaprenyl diphosphate synthase